MAADFIMPAPHTEQHQQHQQQPVFFPQRPSHNRTQSYQIPYSNNISPASTSTGTGSMSSSPSNAAVRKPLFMPAVLRANHEFTPQKLAKSNTNADDWYTTETQRQRAGAFANLPGLAVLGGRSRRPSKVGKELCGELGWNLSAFPEVTDEPSRNHWKPDAQSTVCDDPSCKRNFSYIVRRHHCRKCGNIFCDWHSGYVVPLDQNADFNPRAEPSRTCHHCFDQFKAWHTRNNSQTSSAASSDVDAQNNHTVPPTPVSAVMPGTQGPTLPPANQELAASVPRDWNWSTF